MKLDYLRDYSEIKAEIFTQEQYLDFKDYVKPFKNTIKIIHSEDIYKANVNKSFTINPKEAKSR